LRVSGKEILHRVTTSSFSSPWVEGTSPRYAPQDGSSTFNHQRHPNVPWAFPGSDLTAVMLGQGGTIWRMADATPPDGQGWQEVPVDPKILAARVAGISYGLLVFDDTGSEWTRRGEQFDYRIFPNRFVHSRHSGEKNAPYLTVSLGERDVQPPPAPTGPAADTTDLPAGSVSLSWITPQDRGPAGTIGFLVHLSGRDIPRYLIPPAAQPGERVTMRLSGMPTAWRKQPVVTLRTMDAAGNVSGSASIGLAVSSKQPQPLPGKPPQPFRKVAALPKLGGAEVAVLDALDKVHPVTGKMIPEQPADYPAANHLWSAAERQIRVAAARGEFVAFQLSFRGTVRGVRPSLRWKAATNGRGFTGGKIKVEFSRYRHVVSKKGPLPDTIVPLAGSFNVASDDEKIAGAKHGSLLCEMYVPHDATAGGHPGMLTAHCGGETLKIEVLLWVWDFTLPDYLSFLPEMNCYGMPNNERAYYRLAHLHRTVLNRVPYSQSGHVHEGCAPRWDGRRLDFSAWDRRFGPYFDGSAFADLPRGRVPLECFYLPMHENWPSTMDANYNGDYWADRAFRPGYREAFVEVARQMAEHFNAKGWNRTIFQCYLNNKNNFKRRGWSRGSSPWLLDEPANFQDYWALRYFGEAFHEGVRRAKGTPGGTAKLCFRCDISRPQWQRNSLDHVLDYNVVGGRAFAKYHRCVIDRKQQFGQIVIPYGTTNAVEESNMQPVGWCLDSWTLDGDGVLPWQTIGRENSWKQADTLALFYPGQVVGLDGPVPSIRLKAYRRGQQDVEYLTLLSLALRQPRWAVGQSVRKALRLSAEHHGTGFVGGQHAGGVPYASLLPQDVWSLRVQVAQALSARKPEPRRRLIELRTPPRDPAAAPPAYVEGVKRVKTPKIEQRRAGAGQT